MKQHPSIEQIRNAARHCECGAGCTYAEFVAATTAANKLARRLGPAWKPDVWENLGWHYAVQVAGLRVHPSRDHFAAAIGMHSATAKTPIAAVRAVLKAATAELDALRNALDSQAHLSKKRRAEVLA